jgi:hypothetical protein
MTETTPTDAIRNSEPAKPEQARTESQEDRAGPSAPQANQSQASGRSTAPGRKPLFRS